jgi:hypothetical protein
VRATPGPRPDGPQGTGPATGPTAPQGTCPAHGGPAARRPMACAPNGPKKAEGPLLWSGPSKPRRRPTLPQGCPCSTIGPGELNFRVRDGNGCDLSGIAARKNWRNAKHGRCLNNNTRRVSSAVRSVTTGLVQRTSRSLLVCPMRRCKQASRWAWGDDCDVTTWTFSRRASNRSVGTATWRRSTERELRRREIAERQLRPKEINRWSSRPTD